MRERAGDRAHAEAPHRCRAAAEARARHPFLVGRRDLGGGAVLRGSSRGARAHPGEHQPGHGRRQAVGGQSCSVRDPAAISAGKLSGRCRAVDRRDARRGQHGVPGGRPGAPDASRRFVAVWRKRRHRRREVQPAGYCPGWARESGTMLASFPSTTTPIIRPSTWRPSACLR